jgi:formate hydrogenlyase subunit 4
MGKPVGQVVVVVVVVVIIIIIIIIINTFHGRNNITCSTKCKYRTAATVYTVQTWLVLGM